MWREQGLDGVGYFLTIIERSFDTKLKRHILGGALMSVSLFFGGLATTIMSFKAEGMLG